MNMIYWDHYYNAILLLNLLIATGLFASMRLFSGKIAHINATEELLQKDNPAFGISLAGATLAVTIMLSGTFYGSPENDLSWSVIAVGILGITGIAMMAVTRFIFDKITLPSINLRDEIVRGNSAVAIADAGNVLAAAIIIRAVMIWVTVDSLEGIAALLSAFAVSQLILTSMTVIRIKAFGTVHNGGCLQTELKSGNTALALRFAGQKIGAAFALATAARIVVYEEYDIAAILFGWLIASIAVIAVWWIVCWAAERIILFRTDPDNEVIRQRNVAVGVLEAVLYASMGLLISSL